MALLSSTAPQIGSDAPSFDLPVSNPAAASGAEQLALGDVAGARALLVVFTCNHCPYAIAVEDRLITLAQKYAGQGLQTVAISSNDSQAYPADSFANMTIRAQEKNFPFPYLHDETQEIARAYGAVCTPDFFLYDAGQRLVYAGRLDDGRPGMEPTTQDLNVAVRQVLASEPIAHDQIPSMGCSIKWKV